MLRDIPDPVDLGLAEYERSEPVQADAAGWVFHKENPHVAHELRALAVQLLCAGHRRYSIKGLFEVMRFNSALSTTGKQYKLNNNLTPFYARLLMNCEPMLEGFFHTRESK